MRIVWTLWLLTVALAAQGQTLVSYTDQAAFQTDVGNTEVIDFEDVAVMTFAPFNSGSVSVAGAGQVIDDLVGLDHGFWFEGQASPTRFLLTNANESNEAVDVSFSESVVAVGFLYNCFACDGQPFDSEIHWELFGSGGQLVFSGTEPLDLTFAVHFIGFTIDVPISRIEFYISDVSGPGGGNWMLDDIEFRTAAADDAVFASSFEE